jgi:aspartate racemase
MKTIGLIGGTSWVSTIDYYRYINRMTNERVGRSASAKILLYSVNFEEFLPPADPKGWEERGQAFSTIAQTLERGGADCLLFCANTPHLLAETVQSKIGIPLIHIAEATAKEIAQHKLTKVGLLGTKITMEQPFYHEKLLNYGISAVTPDENDRAYIHKNIFAELTKEIFTDETRRQYLDIIGMLKRQGAQGIIFGCTEIPILIKQSDLDIPAFDTTKIHARAAVDFALG